MLTLLEQTKNVLGWPVVKLGGTEITLWAVIYFLALVLMLFYLAGKLRSLLVNRVLVRSRLDLGARQAIGAITRYVILFLGLLIILQTVGINLTTLNVLAGALGIGIGFGLQNIASNFISGLIILFERPIRVGDRIEVSDVEGDVVEIGARSTKVLTNDNIAIIVPNSKFITETVINWEHYDGKVRFRVPVTVAYDSDLELVETLLLEAAAENSDVLKAPPPAIRFLRFGDKGLYFELRVWSTSLVHRKGTLISALNYAIFAKFKAQRVEIPFQQDEFYIRGGCLELKQEAGCAAAQRADAG